MGSFIVGLALGLGIGIWVGIILAQRKYRKNKKK